MIFSHGPEWDHLEAEEWGLRGQIEKDAEGIEKAVLKIKRKPDESQRSKMKEVSSPTQCCRELKDLHKGQTGVVGRMNGHMLVEVIQQQEEIVFKVNE